MTPENLPTDEHFADHCDRPSLTIRVLKMRSVTGEHHRDLAGNDLDQLAPEIADNTAGGSRMQSDIGNPCRAVDGDFVFAAGRRDFTPLVPPNSEPTTRGGTILRG